jgi:hypothetical protein
MVGRVSRKKYISKRVRSKLSKSRALRKRIQSRTLRKSRRSLRKRIRGGGGWNRTKSFSVKQTQEDGENIITFKMDDPKLKEPLQRIMANYNYWVINPNPIPGITRPSDNEVLQGKAIGTFFVRTEGVDWVNDERWVFVWKAYRGLTGARHRYIYKMPGRKGEIKLNMKEFTGGKGSVKTTSKNESERETAIKFESFDELIAGLLTDKDLRHQLLMYADGVSPDKNFILPTNYLHQHHADYHTDHL